MDTIDKIGENVEKIFSRYSQLTARAGGGIVYDSISEHERLEMVNKARAITSVLECWIGSEVGDEKNRAHRVSKGEQFNPCLHNGL